MVLQEAQLMLCVDIVLKRFHVGQPVRIPVIILMGEKPALIAAHRLLDEAGGDLHRFLVIGRIDEIPPRAQCVLGEGDELFVFDYVPDKHILERVMSFAIDAGAGTTLIADQVDVQLVNRADAVIVVNRGEINFKNSMAVPIAFANLLILTIELIGGEAVQADLRNIEEKREKYGLSYFK